MFLKKKIDYELPQNIMTMVSTWIDCYNSNIREKTKIKMHYDFESKINDTEIMTASKKMSNSAKRSENERIKLEQDIFKWLSSHNDKNVDIYAEKLSNLMSIDKDFIIKRYVNNIRLQNKMKEFNPNYFIKEVKKEVVKKEENDEKKEVKEEKKGNIVYGDAWDLI
jgi:hypothetical protein